MKVKACCAPLVHGCGNNLRSQTVEGSHVDRLPDLKFAANRAIGQLASAKADQRKAQGSWVAAPTHIPVLAALHDHRKLSDFRGLSGHPTIQFLWIEGCRKFGSFQWLAA